MYICQSVIVHFNFQHLKFKTCVFFCITEVSALQLIGYNEPATLQVFIGSEVGRVKPHGFYQACKVCGKNSTQCTEREIEGTNVIEIEISPINDMQVK